MKGKYHILVRVNYVDRDTDGYKWHWHLFSPRENPYDLNQNKTDRVEIEIDSVWRELQEPEARQYHWKGTDYFEAVGHLNSFCECVQKADTE